MCEHEILRGGVFVTRCVVHSKPEAGVQVWTWAGETVTAPCPCTIAARFVVAHESASGRWLSAADVVVAAVREPAAAVVAADRLGLLPGCGLVFVPLADGGAVLRLRDGRTARAGTGLCPACAYPWLAIHRGVRRSGPGRPAPG